MQPIRPYSITAPGFYGLNTNDAPVDLDSKFSATANNCVIDKYGRIGTRKGWLPVSTNTNAQLGSAKIKALGELTEPSGARTILAAGNGNLYKLSGTTLQTLTYGGPGVAPTIAADNWQMVFLGNAMVFFQRGYDPLIYDPTISTTQYRRMSEHATYSGTIPKANCALSAWGRIWCADTDTETMTVTWCDTLTYQKWTAGAAGSLNLQGVWPAGGDRIVALASHNNYLVIFGAKQILIYQGANNPSTMSLLDSISAIGCAARDSVQDTGDDLIFLSDSGVRSVERTIQEKSAPIGNLSLNVNDQVQSYLGAELSGDTIKAIYSPNDSFYLLTFLTSGATFCFDTREKLPNGTWKVTTWSSNVPNAYLYTKDRILYMGQAGGIGKYGGYSDNGSPYRMSWYTVWIDFGNPEQTSILKKIRAIIIGVSNQQLSFKWGFDYSPGTKSLLKVIPVLTVVSEYGFAEYGIDEYSATQGTVQLSIPASGSGQVVQAGIEFDVNGTAISIQHVSIYTKDGRY